MNINQTVRAGVCTIAASGLFLSPAIAKKDAPEPIRLAPSSNWNVDFADDSCRLARLFGEGEEQALLYFERYEPGDRFFFVVAGSPMATMRNRTSAFLQFGSGMPEFETKLSRGSVGDFSPALLISRITFEGLAYKTDSAGKEVPEETFRADIFAQEIDPEVEAKIDQITVRDSRKTTVIFETGSLGEPMKVLRSCTEDLLSHWGIDVEKHRNLRKNVVPSGNPGSWVTNKDYPKDLLRKNVSGLVQFRLSIDAEGRPTDCHIQQSSRPQAFDKVVCENLMKNGEFEPAETSSGEPIASYWRSAVRFEVGG